MFSRRKLFAALATIAAAPPKGFALLVAGALVPAGTACRAKPTREECETMVGRYVEMTVAQDPSLAGVPPLQAGEVRAARIAERRATPEFARAVGECQKDVSRTELTCALAAPTPNDWEACIE